VVVVSDGEAASRGICVVHSVDLTAEADTHRQRNDVPVGPARAAENSSICGIVVCDGQPWTVVVLDVRIEHSFQRRVAALAARSWTGSWPVAP